MTLVIPRAVVTHIFSLPSSTIPEMIGLETPCSTPNIISSSVLGL